MFIPSCRLFRGDSQVCDVSRATAGFSPLVPYLSHPSADTGVGEGVVNMSQSSSDLTRLIVQSRGAR